MSRPPVRRALNDGAVALMIRPPRVRLPLSATFTQRNEALPRLKLASTEGSQSAAILPWPSRVVHSVSPAATPSISVSIRDAVMLTELVLSTTQLKERTNVPLPLNAAIYCSFDRIQLIANAGVTAVMHSW